MERAGEEHDRQFKKSQRDRKSLNRVVYNIPEEGKTAKNRLEALKSLHTALNIAAETALDEYGEKGLEKFVPLFIARRAYRQVCCCTRPRLVRLVFSSLIHRHIFLKCTADFRQAGFRLDDDLTRAQLVAIL